jgi:hypothetical protein
MDPKRFFHDSGYIGHSVHETFAIRPQELVANDLRVTWAAWAEEVVKLLADLLQGMGSARKFVYHPCNCGACSVMASEKKCLDLIATLCKYLRCK